jgi:hypothetical protein
MVAAIVWLSLTPSPPRIDFDKDNTLGHMVAYGGVMFWFSQLYAEKKTQLCYAGGFAAMGIALEVVQGMLGYRTYDTVDMVANMFGVLAGWAAAHLLPGVLPGSAARKP